MSAPAAPPKKYFFDVWLAQGKTVYRDVPYEVVTDWIQQGRLLGDDRIRPAKTEEWFLIEKVPAFSGFIPKPDPLRTDAQAEALEPVETGFGWRGGEEEEESDPDMIPLIDVSLVLLIFFMMTSTVATVVSKIKVPEVANQADVVETMKLITIGINWISDTEPASYSINWTLESGDRGAENNLTEPDTLKKIAEIMERQALVPVVRVSAHEKLNFDLIKKLSVELEQYKVKGKIGTIHVEVGEKKK